MRKQAHRTFSDTLFMILLSFLKQYNEYDRKHWHLNEQVHGVWTGDALDKSVCQINQWEK